MRLRLCRAVAQHILLAVMVREVIAGRDCIKLSQLRRQTSSRSILSPFGYLAPRSGLLIRCEQEVEAAETSAWVRHSPIRCLPEIARLGIMLRVQSARVQRLLRKRFEDRSNHRLWTITKRTRRQSHSHHHQLFGRHHSDGLSIMSGQPKGVTWEPVFGIGILGRIVITAWTDTPDLTATVLTFGQLGGCGDVLYIASRKDALSVPDSVLQQELTKARPVLRGGIQIARSNQRAARIRFQDCAAHAKGRKQSLLRKRKRATAHGLLPQL